MQGSTIGLTGPTGEVTDDYAYDAWGQVVAETGTSPNPLQYIGELGYYRDEEIQRTHVRRREYDEILGRFFSEDPLRDRLESRGVNLICPHRKDRLPNLFPGWVHLGCLFTILKSF